MHDNKLVLKKLVNDNISLTKSLADVKVKLAESSYGNLACKKKATNFNWTLFKTQGFYVLQLYDQKLFQLHTPLF